MGLQFYGNKYVVWAGEGRGESGMLFSTPISESTRYLRPEPVFVDLLMRPGIDSQPGGQVRNPICRTGPPGYIGWRNRFLGIDSWAP
jgi:hypothetical protein